MSRPSPLPPSGESLPKKTLALVLQTLQAQEAECRMNWSLRMARLEIPEVTQPVLTHLFQFLLRNIESALTDEEALVRAFQAEVMRAQPSVMASDVLVVVGFLEELMISMAWRMVEAAQIESFVRFAHRLCFDLAREALSEGYFPAKLAARTQYMCDAPLVNWLNVLSAECDWKWFALVRTRPQVNVEESALYVPETRMWTAEAPHPERTEQVRKALSDGSPFVAAVGDNLYAVAEARHDPLTIRRFRQTAQWIQNALQLSIYVRGGHGSGRAEMLEVLLEFDDVLASASDMNELLTCVVEHVCRRGGFKRSALFLYNPITQTVEGVHGYNVNVEEIMRIRQTDRDIPSLTQFVQIAKPVFLKDVGNILPQPYVNKFHLSSLLVCPVIDNRRMLGIMLLDHGGRAFTPDNATIRMVEAMLARAGRMIVAQMYRQAGTAPITPLTTLTKREREILQLIADGVDTKEIGRALHISDYTVTEHVSSILRKLGAKNRTEAVAKAMRERIIH
ncbi:LuxR C-terminal-related transcriptional regulator [Alicyclobacillus fructus]|uniref:LuxR C-terminal-related transcriptional regulator n=1 Tax=Alicyclobacillus fructus TaxID=2816082 RepID=UPI001A8C5953|nr:LuxR C-terminal-related transcriptional regulator [Alicyclobacillus fructus]